MFKECIKIITFWIAWTLISLLGYTVTTIVVYLFLDVAELYELGQMAIFRIGLGMVEVGVFGWTGVKISEMMEEDRDLEALDRLEIFGDLD